MSEKRDVTALPLPDVPILFGLRAQGHLPTVERMLAEGATWLEIGEAIGWDGETARRFYEDYEEWNLDA